MTGRRDRAADDGGMGFILFMGAVMALSLLVIWQGERLTGLLLEAARWLLRPLALVSEGHGRELAALCGPEAGAMGPGEAWEILGRAARWYVWPLGLPLVAALASWNWRLGPGDRYRRVLSMRGLLEADLPLSPCVAPALAWPGGILAQPLDSGPWRAGRQPIQLVAAHGLLVDTAHGRMPVPAAELLGEDGLADPRSRWLDAGTALALDRARARAMFVGQFGPRWEGFGALPPHLAGLACAWVFCACGRGERGQALLDAMSLSFRPAEDARPARWRLGLPPYLPARPARPCRVGTVLTEEDRAECLRLLAEDRRVREVLRPHAAWRDLALLALYEAARAGGVLPCAEFLWLRPTERVLWYLCNTMGRRTAWPEVAGPWAHYRAECRVGAMDRDFTGEAEPRVEAAVDALEVAMWEEGWLRTERLSERVRRDRARFGID